MRRNWNGDDCTKIVAYLGRHSSLPDALSTIKADPYFGAETTEDMVRGAFRRHGLSSPLNYLAKAYTGARPPDFEDAETCPNAQTFAEQQGDVFRQARETMPAPAAESSHVFILPDIHSPYHDERALEAALKGGEKWLGQVPSHRRVVLIQGDAQDNYRLSFHDKSPERGYRFKKEVEITNSVLDTIQSIGAQRVVFTEGNHEARLKRYLARFAPELLDMVSMAELLRISKRPGWEWIPFKDHTFIGDTLCTHELGYAGKDALAKTLAAAACSTLTGHTHREGVMEANDVHGNSRFAASFGWLGNRETVDYMYRAVAIREWAHGFGTGVVDSRGKLHVYAHRISDYRTVVDGYEIAA